MRYVLLKPRDVSTANPLAATHTDARCGILPEKRRVVLGVSPRSLFPATQGLGSTATPRPKKAP
jgi:hypothetical protein